MLSFTSRKKCVLVQKKKKKKKNLEELRTARFVLFILLQCRTAGGVLMGGSASPPHRHELAGKLIHVDLWRESRSVISWTIVISPHLLQEAGNSTSTPHLYHRVGKRPG
jgi:hypothetical protein